MTRILTLETLKAHRACATQVNLFREQFRDSVEITEALCLSVASEFEWDWAARNLLSRAARAEYKRVREAARAEYERVRAAARAEYERVCASARAEYQRVRDAAWAEYDRVRAAARAEYQRVRASTFARLYCTDTGK